MNNNCIKKIISVMLCLILCTGTFLCFTGCEKKQSYTYVYENPDYPIIHLVEQDNSNFTVDNITNDKIYTLLNNFVYIFNNSTFFMARRDGDTDEWWDEKYEEKNLEFVDIIIRPGSTKEETLRPFGGAFINDTSIKTDDSDTCLPYSNYWCQIEYKRWITLVYNDGYESVNEIDRQNALKMPAALFEEYIQAVGIDISADETGDRDIDYDEYVLIVNKDIIESLTPEQKVILANLLAKTWELYTTENLIEYVAKENGQ